MCTGPGADDGAITVTKTTYATSATAVIVQSVAIPVAPKTNGNICTQKTGNEQLRLVRRMGEAQ